MGWVRELGCAKNHQVVLMPAKKVFDISELQELSSFQTTTVFRDEEGIEGHPQGPNSMMRQAVWYFYNNNLGPVTFMEPDCIPRTEDAFDQWDREYWGFKKDFMGELRPAHDVTPQYLTGNMVLPKDALFKAPMLGRRGLSKDGVELAFDIVAASQILPQAHLTKLLQQEPKNPDGSSHTFKDFDSLKLLRDGAVFFHPCKDGSLIERLRENRRGFVQQETREPIVASVPTPDRTEILLKKIEELQAEIASLKKTPESVATVVLKKGTASEFVHDLGSGYTSPTAHVPTRRTQSPQHISERIAKAMETKRKKKERSQKMKESWARRRAVKA